jgi:hypothetical protein
VVFGRVIRGYEDVIPKIVDISTDEKDRPKVPIVISNCGELELRKKPVDPQSHQRKHLPLPAPPFPSAWLCAAPFADQVFSSTRIPLIRKALVVEVDDHLFFLLQISFYLFLIPPAQPKKPLSHEM